MTYRVTYKLRNRDVNMFRRLRTSVLYEMLQEVSIAHTEELGMGRKMTLDKGLLWVIIQHRMEFFEPMEYDDEIIVESWPGKTMHVLFPRNYRILKKDGTLCAEGNAMWALIDAETRRFAFPEQYGIRIEEEITGYESKPLRRMEKRKPEKIAEWAVPFSVCDLNGHMNNSRYYDLAEDHMPDVLLEKQVSMIETEYVNEAHKDEVLELCCEGDENERYFLGQTDKICFRMHWKFR